MIWNLKRSGVLAGLMAVTLVAAAGCGSSPATTKTTGSTSSNPSSTPVQVEFGIVGKSATDWPLYIADKKGFFAKNNIKIDMITTGSSSTTAQQLAAGSLNMGGAGLPDFIRAIYQGAPLKIVSSEVATPPYALMGQKNIKSIADLKGKTIIIGGVKDVTHIFLTDMLKPNGLNEGDYVLVYAGSTANRFAALNSGSVAAALLFPPFNFKAAAQGYTDLGFVEKYVQDFPFTGYAVNSAWAQTHKDVLVGFLKSYLEGVKWLYDPANEAEAVQILSEETNTSQSDGQQTYDLLFKQLKAYRTDGAISDAGMTTVLDALVQFGDLKQPLPPVSKFYDGSYITAANQ